MSKVIPLKGEFTRVRTSVRPNEYGYVEERTKDKITVRFKNDIVGIYNIANNDFERINIWWGPEAVQMTLDQRIESLVKTLGKIDFSNPINVDDAPISEKPKRNVREFVDETLARYPNIMGRLKD